MGEKVAIQGIAGSFHHQVATEFFGAQIDIDECMSFREVVRSLLQKNAVKAVMAIENSIAGSILPNYALIDENGLNIIGEYYLPVEMNLMAVPGHKLEDIRKVYSHPIALLQCKEFFDNYPHIKLIEDVDTASVAKRISEKHSAHTAAVASKTAAALFGLDILAEGIHTVKNNTTRFLILSGDQQAAPELPDKASIKFILESKQGSLVTALNVLRDHQLDMTKIQSVPVIEEPWTYGFFIDVIFEDPEKFQRAMYVLRLLTQELKVLGTYRNNISGNFLHNKQDKSAQAVKSI